jgi:hypothetical protein
MVGAAGFEPATFCTPCNCATGLRHAPTFIIFQRDPTFQNGIMVGVRGFEPPTPWSRTKCASHCATPRSRYHFVVRKILKRTNVFSAPWPGKD